MSAAQAMVSGEERVVPRKNNNMNPASPSYIRIAANLSHAPLEAQRWVSTSHDYVCAICMTDGTTTLQDAGSSAAAAAATSQVAPPSSARVPILSPAIAAAVAAACSGDETLGPGVTLFPCQHKCCEPCFREQLKSLAMSRQSSDDEQGALRCHMCRTQTLGWVTHRDGVFELASLAAIRTHHNRSQEINDMFRALQYHRGTDQDRLAMDVECSSTAAAAAAPAKQLRWRSYLESIREEPTLTDKLVAALPANGSLLPLVTTCLAQLAATAAERERNFHQALSGMSLSILFGRPWDQLFRDMVGGSMAANSARPTERSRRLHRRRLDFADSSPSQGADDTSSSASANTPASARDQRAAKRQRQ